MPSDNTVWQAVVEVPSPTRSKRVRYFLIGYDPHASDDGIVVKKGYSGRLNKFTLQELRANGFSEKIVNLILALANLDGRGADAVRTKARRKRGYPLQKELHRLRQ